MGRTIKDLSTCFLTYHTLSSSFQGSLSVHFYFIQPFLFLISPSLSLLYSYIFLSFIFLSLHAKKILFLLWLYHCVDMDPDEDIENAERKRKEGEGISLPPFGLATYKMQGNVWVSGNCGRDQERLVSLLSVADSWLKQLRVQHHDFNYFMGIRRG